MGDAFGCDLDSRLRGNDGDIPHYTVIPAQAGIPGYIGERDGARSTPKKQWWCS
ncbi:hypothetical protein GCM10017655_37490 [Pseudomonas turukhanskensis]|uniref:Uncharacterized protein n=1 Tax=Pseudomonas turukhanskensis TaxID=1806536 RepID=A0A9W6NHA6_9PSED|nr:hypothetical protein GCM10017655_37490 [Pseudomonas turukhanskensis]